MRAMPADLERYPSETWDLRFSYLAQKYYFTPLYTIDPLHGPEAEAHREDCWMCDIIDEML